MRLAPVGGGCVVGYEPEHSAIRFHFFGALDTSGPSPLSEEREPVRRRELRATFTDIRRQVPEAQTFRERFAATQTLDEVLASFPFDVLAPRCSIDHFYAFYGS